jgi:hypothetical protein
MKKKKYYNGGKMDPSQQQDLAGVLGVASSIAPMFGPVGIGVGLAAGLGATALNNSAEKKMRGPHLSTFSGYANGGNIDPLAQLLSQSNALRSLYAQPLRTNYDNSRDFQYQPISQSYMEGSGPSKSKSKDRFRERANGGMIDVNSSSMEVNGNPNQIDSVYYPDKNVYLDDQEIVKNNFVFSNRIKNPLTGNSFAKDSKKIENSTGKAETRLKNSSDPISENTIKRNNTNSEKLAQMQEIIATSMGKRDNQTMGYATGGPFDPLPGQQYMEIYSGPNGVKQYYDPYNNRQVFRKPETGTYFAARDNYALPAKDLIAQHLQAYPGTTQIQQTSQPQTPTVPARPKMEWGSIWGTDRKPVQQSTPVVSNSQAMSGYDPMTGNKGFKFPVNPQVPIIPQTSRDTTGPVPFIPNFDPVNPSPVKSDPLDSVKPSPVNNVKRSPVNSVKPLPGKSWKPVPDSEWDPNMYKLDPRLQLDYPIDTIPYMKQEGVPMAYNTGLNPVSSMNPTSVPILGSNSRNIVGNEGSAATPEQAQNQSYSNNFTTGDYMQIAAALSRAGNFQKTEMETPNLDLTKITRNAYDVNPVLGQNNRNYQNALNNTTTSSPNLRRAIANQLYGQKLNQDSNSLEQYQQMNNQATTQYEDRLSNQRRFNAQQTGYTQDINARNRGAGMNARQAAFDQLGTVGVMLNKRKENQTYINALKVRYPDISDSVLKDILG